MEGLENKKCTPCEIGAIPLIPKEVDEMLKSIDENWVSFDYKSIERTFKFKDFKEALDFTNKVGDLAEEEGHHPKIELSWGKVVIKLYTSKIKGLHENDFILAAKIDKI